MSDIELRDFLHSLVNSVLDDYPDYERKDLINDDMEDGKTDIYFRITGEIDNSLDFYTNYDDKFNTLMTGINGSIDNILHHERPLLKSEMELTERFGKDIRGKIQQNQIKFIQICEKDS